jgi:small ligand-binding sensory domain FIST
MLWASVVSELPDTEAAAEEVGRDLREAMGPGPVDLALAFFDGSHVQQAELLCRVIKKWLAPGCLVGCSARGVIAGVRELETGPSLVLCAARLPGVELHPFVLTKDAWAESGDDPLEFTRMTPGAAGAEIVVILADPFSFEIERCLAAFDRHASDTRVVGGMASAGTKPGHNALILNDWIAHEGGVALAMKGAVRADVVVSQGCRPIGPPLEVTRAHGNFVLELDGQPALERAEQVLQELAEKEREHLKHGLYVGRPARPGARTQGDYLIRNLLGADRDRGAIAIGDHIAERERIRLHVRDAQSARADLEMLLSPQVFDSRAACALLFTCNGRGQALHGGPNGDISILQESLGGLVPAAGMFCAGEIGPVDKRNFLHGHTASIVVLRPAVAGNAAKDA